MGLEKEREVAMMDSRTGRLTMAAGGLIPGANGRKENVDPATAEKLGRLVDQDDEHALDDRSLGMLVSIANRERRRLASSGKGRMAGAGPGALTLDDVKAWIFWRQFHPPEGVPPEPEPEPLDAKFKIKLGFGGMPADAAAQLSAAEYDEEFHVVVNDDRGPDQPRSMTVWRLGGAADADTAVSSGVLHGCRAVRCHLPPGAFKLELANMPANIPDGQERSGSYFFLPSAHQSSEELVTFFNRCGEEPPRVCTDDEHTGPEPAQHPDLEEKMMSRTWSAPPTSVRHTWSAAAVDSGAVDPVRTLRGFEEPEVPVERRQPAAADVFVQSVQIVGTEEGENSKGAKVTHYLIECTSVPQKDQVASVWTIRKRYRQFDEFRKQLETADSSSDASTLGVKDVPFPAKTWGLGVVGKVTVEQRRQKLEKWLNGVVGLNNALVCSYHHELADVTRRFLQPENGSMALTMDQLQSASDPIAQSDVAQFNVVQREAEHVATEESWKADQITGEDGYLHTFEHQLFPSLTTHADGEDSLVLDLQKVLASAAGSSEGGKVAKSEADRLVKAIQAELRSRDETISQLRREREYVDLQSLLCPHSDRCQLCLRSVIESLPMNALTHLPVVCAASCRKNWTESLLRLQRVQSFSFQCWARATRLRLCKQYVMRRKRQTRCVE